MKSINQIVLLFILLYSTASLQAVTFLESLGVFDIPGSKEKIAITKEDGKIQFRIRGAGPTQPTITPDAGWFIAIVDKDHVWVHTGGGRLFYYSWLNESGSRSRVDEWTYPKMGAVALPPEIEHKLKK